MVSCPSWEGSARSVLPMARYMLVSSTLSHSSAVNATARAAVVRRRAHLATRCQASQRSYRVAKA